MKRTKRIVLTVLFIILLGIPVTADAKDYTANTVRDDLYEEINIATINLIGTSSLFASAEELDVSTKGSVPWFKVIVYILIALIAGWYIFDVAVKYRYGEARKRSQSASKEEMHDSKCSQAERRKTAIKEMLELIIPVTVAVIVLKGIIMVTVIQSASMEPTMMTGNTVFVNRLAYKINGEVQRGDIVFFNSREYGKLFGKRVIGLPGDIVEFENGYVVLNGQCYDESAYLSENITTNCPKTFEVPEGCYFVLGDNRAQSNDARYWKGPYIKESDIVGNYMGQIDFSIQFDLINRFFK